MIQGLKYRITKVDGDNDKLVVGFRGAASAFKVDGTDMEELKNIYGFRSYKSTEAVYDYPHPFPRGGIADFNSFLIIKF